MASYRQWILTLGIVAVTPGIGMAGPFSSLFKTRPAQQAAPAPKRTEAGAKSENQKTAENIPNALRSAKLNRFELDHESQKRATHPLAIGLGFARATTLILVCSYTLFLTGVVYLGAFCGLIGFVTSYPSAMRPMTVWTLYPALPRLHAQ